MRSRSRAARRSRGSIPKSARKAAPNVETAALPAAGLDVPACGLDHVLDDRQPEPAAARGARSVGAEEALEQPLHVLLGDPGTVVGDLEHDRAVVAPERDRAGRSLARVPEYVLEQVLRDEPQH